MSSLAMRQGCSCDTDMSLVMQVCDTIHVLDYGQLIAVGSPEQIRQDPAVADASLGTVEESA